MKILNAILLTAFLFISVPYAEASTEEEELRLQLVSIVEYLERLLPPNNVPLSADQMRTVITDGADWLVAGQERSGRFGYEYLPYVGEYTSGDNIVRQAGSLYILGEFYRAQDKSDRELEKAIESSIDYFKDLSKSLGDGEGACVRSGLKSFNCQTGTTALALLGILSYVEQDTDLQEKYYDAITDYADFLLASRLEGAGFSENYNFGGGFKDSESPFFTGETMLALVRYYQYDARPEVKEVLNEVFDYLKEKEYESPLYLWIMAALKDMQALWPNDEYVEYASDFTSMRLNDAVRRHGTVHNYCAPLEGLTSAYSVLAGNESKEYLTRLNDEIEYWLALTTDLQLDAARPYRVAMIDNTLQMVKVVDPALAHGGFLTGQDEPTQRIDFTQHCMSAYLQKLEDIDGQRL